MVSFHAVLIILITELYNNNLQIPPIKSKVFLIPQNFMLLAITLT